MAIKPPPLTFQEQLARCKMRALSEGTRIWQLEAEPTPRFASPSSTDVGVAYEIICHNIDTGDVSCNCKAPWWPTNASVMGHMTVLVPSPNSASRMS